MCIRDSPETDTAGQEEKLTILTDLLEKSQALLADTPLDLRALVYHGYASYYRARFEHSFETRLPYYNQALVSLRRARIIADPTLEGQLAYMLGRIYFYKRDYFYDLAERYLEQAIHLGYKGQESYEYLVVINDAWGNAERSIEYLEKVLKERTDDMYLFRLAGNYWKVGRTEEAVRILEGIINRTDNENLGRECRFLLGEISFAAGKFSAAEAQYRSILEKDDDSAEAHFRLALIYEKKGDYVQYRYQLRRTLENDPGHSGARSRLR